MPRAAQAWTRVTLDGEDVPYCVLLEICGQREMVHIRVTPGGRIRVGQNTSNKKEETR